MIEEHFVVLNNPVVTSLHGAVNVPGELLNRESFDSDAINSSSICKDGMAANNHFHGVAGGILRDINLLGRIVSVERSRYDLGQARHPVQGRTV